MHSSLQLADDVFLCLTGDRIVFLDLRRNKYLCLNQQHSQVALSLFDRPTNLCTESQRSVGRLSQSVAKSPPAVDGDVRSIMQALIEQGLLEERREDEGRTTSPTVEAPTHALSRDRSELSTAKTLRHAPNFLRSTLIASWKLKSYSMQQTVRSVQRRKQQRGDAYNKEFTFTSDLAAIFQHLRPYYPRKYLCLYDSLALLEFLAGYDIFPEWVFGVTAEPFNAHCWVQDNHRVLNDSVEFVRGFTPIMVV